MTFDNKSFIITLIVASAYTLNGVNPFQAKSPEELAPNNITLAAATLKNASPDKSPGEILQGDELIQARADRAANSQERRAEKVRIKDVADEQIKRKDQQLEDERRRAEESRRNMAALIQDNSFKFHHQQPPHSH